MSRLQGFSLALFTSGLLLASPVSAVSTVYDMTGSTMRMFNQACGPCTVAVTGTVTLDDDGAGNILLTEFSLSHVAYQVGIPALLSIVIERPSIELGAGSVAGTGSTSTTAVFGPTTIAQTGSATCTNAAFACTDFGVAQGVTLLPGTLTVDVSTWTFDALGGFSARLTYMAVPNPPATENLHLVGTPVPEPGTAVLVALGTAALAWRRRAPSADPAAGTPSARSR